MPNWVSPERDFTTLSNDVIRDGRLSYRARGLLISLLSRPANWRCDAEQLSREGKEGRDAIRTALKELLESGYMVTRKYRTEQGTWASDIEVYDTPQPKSAGQDQDGHA